MMKRLTLSAVFSLVFVTVFAQFGIGSGFGIGQTGQQKLEPHVRWEITTSAETVCIGDQIKVVFEGDIDRKWHIYSVGFDCDPGPGLANISLEGTGFTKVGDLKAIDDEPYYEDIFECDARLFEKKARFEQIVKITGTNPKIEAKIAYQACTEGTCIPETSPTISLEPAMGDKCKSVVNVVPKETVKTIVNSSDCCVATQDSLAKIRGDIASLEEKVDDYFNPSLQPSADIDCKIPRKAGFDDITIEGVPDTSKEDEESGIGALWGIFGASFLFGLIALLTPCVFPLIPMTVTFFTHSSKSKVDAIRKALIYGASIVVIYTVLGLLVAKFLGANAANELATGWINIVFFLIFFVFALSFLGLFEITLPTKFVNKMDAQSEKGGLLGIFFMAFTLALVSFSCTGPIVGSTLVLAAGGYWLKPVAGMLGFSLALAIPFTLFAIFPHALNKLPKSGGWLNAVKVVLGLLELAVGLKFLSNADLAHHWGIMDRDTFLILWIAIFFVMGLYLLGKIRLPHDSPVEKLSVMRLLLSTATFAFVIYLIPGLFGAPLKALAGITPPMITQDFVIGKTDSYGADTELCDDPMYADKLHLPFGLKGYYDIRQAICCAEKQHKPIFIDFTGHGCANCRKMEEFVWVDPEVKKRLKENFIILSLYVDDKNIKIPVNERFTNANGEEVTLLGQYNFAFEQEKFNQVAQPYYIVLGVDEKNTTPSDIRLSMLADPYVYDTDIEKFKNFLDDAKDKYLESKLMVKE